MKKYTSILFLTLACQASAQTVSLRSFEHTVRWVSETNFPALVRQKSTQDSLFQVAASIIAQHFGATDVKLPPGITYAYISGFGKDKVKEPAKDGPADETGVYIHTLITRATAGYGVHCRMYATAVKGGETVYEKKTEHELEYFTASGYLSDQPWYDEAVFIALYRDLLRELFAVGEPLPAKIRIGSQELVGAAAAKRLTDPEMKILNTAGKFMQGSNYELCLRSGTDTVTKVSYYNGWDWSLPKVEINMSRLAAELFKSLTHVDFGYRTRTREIRYGRFIHAGGHTVKLRMEWTAEGTTYTDGSSDWAFATSPMVLDAYQDDSLIAYFTYHTGPPGDVAALKQEAGMKGSLPAGNYWLEGMIRDRRVVAGYDDNSAQLTVFQDGKPLMVVLLVNIDTASRSLSNQTLSKNKLFVTSSNFTIGRPNLRKPEAYLLYHEKGMKEEDLVRCLDAIMCLLFGMGS